jgi:hypothetical protein
MSEYDYNKASILVLAFFSLSSSQPLLSQIRRESKEFCTMGQALGIPDSEQNSRIDPNEPLDTSHEQEIQAVFYAIC